MEHKTNIHPLTLIVTIIIFALSCSPSWAGALLSYPKFMALDSSGAPLIGGKLYTYEQGSSTPKATYSDYDLSTPNANPVVLDSRGEAVVYGSGYYKFVLKDSDDVAVWTFDNLLAGEPVDWVSISDYGNSLVTAVSDIGATNYTLLIDRAITVSDNVTVPANINLWVLNIDNGAIQVDSGKTVTYNCTITAGSYQIFGGTGTHTTTGVVGEYNEKWESSGNHHVKIGGIVLPEQSTVPTTGANQGAVYTKETLGQTELWAKEESDGDEVQVTGGGALLLPNSYIAGLTMSNDTDTQHDILVAVGQAKDSTDAVNLILSTAITKQLDATWASGDDVGGLNDTDYATGSSGPEVNTWYHVFLLGGSGGVDVCFDKDISATNCLADSAVTAANLTKYRRIGSILTDASENIVNFEQVGNHFQWDDPTALSDGNVDNGLETISIRVPPDITVVADIRVTVVYDTEAGSINVYGYGQAQDDPTATDFDLRVTADATTASTYLHRIVYDQSLRYESNVSGGMDVNTFVLQVNGYIDYRSD